ncbi:hypothetical protein OG552_30560 [Streptomyces sp. NBC_01476]|uniref:WXG100 family type VII secretion target n=1 Tax=Streptomyces sp. NBC_01476 TaxID=2903881 RepID=UPI002E2FCA77|nr:hypothetical protein [Streptomyces sp. NBC_01476]
MALPANWDSAVIRVDPYALDTCRHTLDTASHDILNALTDIINSLNALKLAWTGDSAGTATDYQQRWDAVQTKLYGTQADPSTGALNILAGGVAQAASNYSHVEAGIADMFNSFEKGLLNSSSGGGNQIDEARGTPIPNYHTTTVNEIF